MWGTNVILPFKAGNWLDSRLTLVGMQVHQRCDDFFDIPFNRRKWMFNSSLDNTFKVGFANDRISLSARCSDLFNSGMPNLKVRFNGQHLDMNNDFYSRSFTIHFSYRFGGYKKKEAGKIDTSRFGH